MDEAEEGKATEIVAEKIGVARGLLEMALWLRENAPGEELERLGGEEVPVSRKIGERGERKAREIVGKRVGLSEPPLVIKPLPSRGSPLVFICWWSFKRPSSPISP